MYTLVPNKRWFYYTGFYAICIIVFAIAFSNRNEFPFEEAFGRSVWPTVQLSGILILPASYLFAWKKFWSFYVVHSILALLLMYAAYSQNIETIQPMFSLNQAVMTNFRPYIMISLPFSVLLSLLSLRNRGKKKNRRMIF